MNDKIYIIIRMQLAKPFFIITLMLLMPYISPQTCTSAQYSFNGVCAACQVTCLTCSSGTSTSCLTCGTNRTISSQKACKCNTGYIQNNPVSAGCAQIACNFRCLTCNNTATTCLTCKSTDNRILVSSSNTCPCITKYFDNGVATCVSCHYSCGQCTGATNILCSSCQTSSFRTFQSGNKTCTCNNGYYDNGVYICVACYYKCATCSASPNCLTCATNRNTTPACLCNTNFYDDGITAACISCHYSCSNCNNGSACTTCDNTKFRVTSSLSTYCMCENKYFDNGVTLCVACNVRCATCVNANQCLTCNQTAFRIYNNANKFCDCRVGYYQTAATTQLCGLCNSRCLTCSASASTSCLTCDAAKNRVFSSGSCNCNIGFFQNTFETCSACHSSCYTCTNASQCLACKSSTLEVKNSSQLCSCNSTHYFNTGANKCQPCNYKCNQCVITNSINCTSCPINSFRTYSNGNCPCNTYYFDNGVSICVRCHYSCLSCTSTTFNTCLSCTSAAKRTLISTQCKCQALFYDNGALQLCQPCLYNCLTCNNATGCLTCNTTLFRVLNSTANPQVCACKLYYYQNSNLTCSICHYNCYTCNNPTTCLTCNADYMFRQYNASTQNCDCINRYYDDFVHGSCLSCLPQCLTCTNATRCLTCDLTLNRILTSTNYCPCKDKFVDVAGVCVPCMYQCQKCTATATCTVCNLTAFRKITTSNRCICNDGYYEDASNELCPKCAYACLTCVSTAIKCLTCDTNLRVLISNWCACPTKYFDNNITVACLNCHYTCQTCLQFNTCQQCNISNFRIFDSINQYCICSIGYYDDGGSNELCKTCNYKCYTCTNLTQCLTCSSTSFRATPADMCPCFPGYYDNGVNICLKCHYSCQTCTNGSQCLSCNTLVNYRQFETNFLCKCLNRYYDDGSNQKCLTCIYNCLTCDLHSTNCTNCNSSANRILQSNNCKCMNRYYDNLAQQCLSCHYTCLTCISGSSCQTCSSTNFRQINNTNGLCKCMNRYWDDGTNQLCRNCDPSCFTCTNAYTCITCDIARNRILNSTTDIYAISSPFCVCRYRYFSLSSSADCSPCHYSCEVCNGAERNKCVYCNNTAQRQFNASQCLCKIGFYDDLNFEPCQACHISCVKCTTGLPNSCTICSSLYYLLISTTSCYSLCPNQYFNYQLTYTCQSCSYKCKTCLNASYCSLCDTGYLLYDYKCVSICPIGTFSNIAQGICVECPKGCSSCTGNSLCLDCFEKYYFNIALGFCFTCSSNCKSCTGPGQTQCTACMSPYILINNQSCSTLVCMNGQYVDPLVGCKSCSSLYVGSSTCNYYEPLSCNLNYRLLNKTCIFCTGITGYTMINNACTQICGDGILYTLQCDDGNKINGDGCSSSCLIEQGWICIKNATNTSVCSLIDSLKLTLQKYIKYSGQNKIDLYLILNLPVLIISNHLTMTIQDFSSADYEYSIQQTSDNLRNIIISLSYKKQLQGKLISFLYSRPSRRLLHDQNRQLAAMSFTSSFNVDSFPPALYYQNQTLNEFKSIKEYLTALSLCLLVLCLIIIPKRMHLHILTCIYIPAQVYYTYGLLANNQTDWIKYCLQNVYQAALKGGFNFGKCCTIQSNYYNFSTEIINVSGISILSLSIMWLFYALAYLFHKYCKRINQKLKKIQYFLFTLTLFFMFGFIYSSINSLYHFNLVTNTDTFNSALGVLASIILLAIVIGIWIITYYKNFPLNKTNRKIYNSNKDIIQEQELSSQNSQQTDGSKNQKLKQNDLGFFDYDYIELYNHRILKNKNDTINIVFSKAKYFLPILITKIYLTALLASLFQALPHYYFTIQSILEFAFIIFLISARPFRSTFTNLRLILVSLLIIAADIITFIYLFQSLRKIYVLLYEKIALYIILSIFASTIFFICIEHLLAWKHQIIGVIEPCLKGLRLLGTKRRTNLDFEEISVKESKILMSSTKRQSNDGDILQSVEQIDAFYARMLKKEHLNKQYRRQRMLKI